MAFGIVIYDQDRRIVAIDDAAALLFGQSSQALVTRSITDFVPQPDRAQLAEARATFERYGEASGRYAIEREDGSLVSHVYSVRADSPMPGLNLMALTASEEEVAADPIRVRRVGSDVHVGLEASYEQQWAGTSAPKPRSAPRPIPAGASGALIAAVFPTEQDGWAAVLATQIRIDGIDVALSAFDGGWPRDPRSVLAVRGADGRRAEVAAIVAEFGGTLMAGRTTI